jgi:hypothetical protein
MMDRSWFGVGIAVPAQKRKTRIVDAGFLITRLVTFRLVADPHRPRTIIRARIIAAVRINQRIGEKSEHEGEPNRFLGQLASIFYGHAGKG